MSSQKTINKIKRNVNEINNIASLYPKKASEIKEIGKLYAKGEIERFDSAMKLVRQVTSRGQGPAKAISQIRNIQTNAAANEAQRIEDNREKTYYVSGTVQSKITYAPKTNKSGRKGKQYKAYEQNTKPTLYRILAKNEKEAKKIFESKAKGGGHNEGSYLDSDGNYIEEVEDINIDSITTITSANIRDIQYIPMYSATTHLTYSFIKADETVNKNAGLCVADALLSFYAGFTSALIKKFDFDELQKIWISVNHLPIDSKMDLLGVTPMQTLEITKYMGVGSYALDYDHNCFLRNEGNNNRWKPLIYYAMNGHMSLITDPKERLKISARCREQKAEKKNIYTSAIIEETKKENPLDLYPIYNNISMDKIIDMETSNIIYTDRKHLNEIFDFLITKYNIVPDHIKLHGNLKKSFDITLNNNTYYLYVDQNDQQLCNFRIIQQYCKDANIAFKNQTSTQFTKEIRDIFIANENKRRLFTPKQRDLILKKHNNKCDICNEKLTNKESNIDHIIPIKSGGSNSPKNLQILCVPCHSKKTNMEKKMGCMNLSLTKSSFNSTIGDMIKSPLCNAYSRVEHIVNDDNIEQFGATRTFTFDQNKSRKNVMLNNKFDFPLFCVPDKQVTYTNQTCPGYYYVETENIEFFRGNGLYQYPTIKYALEMDYITNKNIKFVIPSGQIIPYDYYNEFINHVDQNFPEHSKLMINSMIGAFNVKDREIWISKKVTTCPNEAFKLADTNEHIYMDVRRCNEKQFYELIEVRNLVTDETEKPIYDMIIELEIIELDKLKNIIKSKGGVCLDTNTDSLTFCFKGDVLPFDIVEIDGKKNIDGYFWNENKNTYKYKLEEKDDLQYRTYVERMPMYKRTDKLKFEVQEWNTIIENEDYNKNMEAIIKYGSCFIEGLAGTGKSYIGRDIIKMLQNLGMKIAVVAPTNKAARVIGGITINKFYNINSKNSRRIKELDYIIIDEVSMMPEWAYKYFIQIQKSNHKLKFIFIGNFDQLPAIDRAEFDYINSPVFHDLCNNNKFELKICKRSDKTYFDLIHPKNINNIDTCIFGNKETKFNICYTNEMRKKINKKYMDEHNKGLKTKMYKFDKLQYDPNSQDVTISKGMPIISHRNSIGLDISNGETFKITNVSDTIQIRDIYDEKRIIEINPEDFQTHFYLSYAITCHKSQGETFNHPYTIHQWEHFTQEMKYVALSRTTQKEYVNIV